MLSAIGQLTATGIRHVTAFLLSHCDMLVPVPPHSRHRRRSPRRHIVSIDSNPTPLHLLVACLLVPDLWELVRGVFYRAAE